MRVNSLVYRNLCPHLMLINVLNAGRVPFIHISLRHFNIFAWIELLITNMKERQKEIFISEIYILFVILIFRNFSQFFRCW